MKYPWSLREMQCLPEKGHPDAKIHGWPLFGHLSHGVVCFQDEFEGIYDKMPALMQT